MSIFRLLTDRQIRRQARQDARFAARAQARLINREARAGEQNAAGIAAALAAAEGGYGSQIKDIYSRAQQNLSGYANSQRAALGQISPPGPPTSTAAGGNTLADMLAHKLELGGQSSDLAQGLKTQTAGAAAAGYGNASAELGALAQRQAAAEEFGAKLPELARLTGLQGVQERQARARQDQARLQAQMAQATLQEINSARNREFQKGASNLAYSGKVMDVVSKNRRASQSEAGKNARAAASLTIAQQRANESARHNKAMEGIDTSTEAGREAAAKERARHNRVSENIQKRSGRERRRHNRASEQKSGGGGGPPWHKKKKGP